MKKIAIALNLLLCAFTAHLQGYAISAHAIDGTSGNGISAWEVYDPSSGNNVIRASLLDGATGTWAPADTISDPNTNSHTPKVAIGDNGGIAVIWETDNPTSGLWWLSGASYDYASVTPGWNPPTVLSTSNDSLTGFEDYHVKISNTDKISVTYVSVNQSTYAYEYRGIFSPTYGTWGTPVNIDP